MTLTRRGRALTRAAWWAAGLTLTLAGGIGLPTLDHLTGACP